MRTRSSSEAWDDDDYDEYGSSESDSSDDDSNDDDSSFDPDSHKHEKDKGIIFKPSPRINETYLSRLEDLLRSKNLEKSIFYSYGNQIREIRTVARADNNYTEAIGHRLENLVDMTGKHIMHMNCYSASRQECLKRNYRKDLTPHELKERFPHHPILRDHEKFRQKYLKIQVRSLTRGLVLYLHGLYQDLTKGLDILPLFTLSRPLVPTFAQFVQLLFDEKMCSQTINVHLTRANKANHQKAGDIDIDI